MSTPDHPPCHHADGSAGAPDGHRRHRTHDLHEAQQVVSDVFMPHRLRVSGGSPLTLELVGAEFGEITAGLVTYGVPARVSTDRTPEYLLTMTLRGRAESRSGSDPPLATTGGQAVVFRVEDPLDINGSADCLQLALKIPRATVEGRLERLLDRGLRAPVRFEPGLRPDTLRLVQTSLHLMMSELRSPSGMATRSTIARHLEGLVVDGMLLAQPHNYLEAVRRETPGGSRGAITRAAELMHEHPGRPWTVVSLAQEVHVSVRALQYGFQRDFDMSPMAYLRAVRLRHVHSALLEASPDVSTVRKVAMDAGFTHLGRFSAWYRSRYGELPSSTLARRAGDSGRPSGPHTRP